jgi:hypothetical protein
MRPIDLELAIQLNFAYVCSQSRCFWFRGLVNVFFGPNFIRIIVILKRRFFDEVFLLQNIGDILVANNVGRSWFLVIILLLFRERQDNGKSGFCSTSELILKNYCYRYILWSSIQSDTTCYLEQHLVLIKAQKLSCFANLNPYACNLTSSDCWKRVFQCFCPLQDALS